MVEAEAAAYLKAVESALRQRNATEHTHRAALERFIEALFPGTDAVNEPTRSECGAPDFVVAKIKPRLTIGYIEAKDVGADLRAIEKTDQIKRYLSLPNLLVTDYLGFRWYTDGSFRAAASLGEWNGKAIVPATDGGAAALALLADFMGQAPQPIRSARALAVRLAVLTHHVRDIIAEARTRDTSNTLRVMQMAFGASLVPEISIPDFADMLSQTIAYGLFAARCADTSPDFSRDEASHLVPRSNPFLQKLFQFIAGRQIDDEPFIGFVEDMVDVLAHADMPAVLRDFGTHKKGEDPIVHFYESFLEAYDPAMRAKRGVYYTPAPVASYMVRSIDHILKTVFKLDAGLADGSTATFSKPVAGGKDGLATQETHPRVLILDPACGTCTFFYVLVNFLRDQFMARNLAGQWPDFVKTNLLPRLFGFELLMAPYAVAHLKLGMQLAALDLPEADRDKWAYTFGKGGGERLAVYLTNTLDEAVRHSEEFWTRFLAEESNEAAAVKHDKPIMVVLGNPPYSGHSANKSAWITGLVGDYKKDCPELHKPGQAKWLQDDYVKFIRWGEWRIEKTDAGILAFITNNSYLDNPTFRGMRKHLMETFDTIHVLDLHGSTKKREKAPDGGKDENVFDIQQGVAIMLAVKHKHTTGEAKKALARVYHADLWGTRELRDGDQIVGGKYNWLLTNTTETTPWAEISASAPSHLFIPQDTKNKQEYDKYWSLPAIFSLNGDPAPGIVTTHDEFAVAFTRDEMIANVQSLLATSSEEAARSLFRLCSQSQWKYADAKKELANGQWKSEIKPILYRPFDIRWTVFNRYVAVHRRERVMRNMIGTPNLALLFMRQVALDQDFSHVGLADTVVDNRAFYSSRGIMFLAPLYISQSADELQDAAGCRSNISPEFLTLLWAYTGHTGDTLKAEMIVHYIYAVLHSPTYRQRYAEFLKTDFPRVPLTQKRDLFDKLAALGDELAALHLMTSPALKPCENPLTSPVQYPATGDDMVDKVRYADGAVFINKAQHFTPVPESVWQFKIGGYQVAEKWLKDRKCRVLTSADKIHYAKITVALARTQELMQEIDRAIPQWPIA